MMDDDDDVWGEAGDDQLDDAALIEASQMAEKYQREGEVKYLRGELRKLEDALDRERKEGRMKADMLREQLASAEAKRRAEGEAAKVDRDFMELNIRQLKEDLGRAKRQQQVVKGEEENVVPKLNRTAMVSSQVVASQIPSTIDRSLFEDDLEKDVKRVHPNKAAFRMAPPPSAGGDAVLSRRTSEASSQTYVRKKRRDNKRLKEKLAKIDAMKDEATSVGLFPAASLALDQVKAAAMVAEPDQAALQQFVKDGESETALAAAVSRDEGGVEAWSRVGCWAAGCMRLLEARNAHGDGAEGRRGGHDLLRALVAAAANVLDACMKWRDEDLDGGAAASFQSARTVCRDCVVHVHQAWSLDPGDFIRTLGESKVATRKYIWLTKQLDREDVRALIGMRPEEGRLEEFVA